MNNNNNLHAKATSFDYTRSTRIVYIHAITAHSHLSQPLAHKFKLH